MKDNVMKMCFGSDYKIDITFEKKLEAFLKAHGFKWYASGTTIKSGVRDIVFDMNRDEKPALLHDLNRGG